MPEIWSAGLIADVRVVGTGVESLPAQKAQFERQFGYLVTNRTALLVTGHRRENFGGFECIYQALGQVERQLPDVDVDVVFPVHFNTRMWFRVAGHLASCRTANSYAFRHTM